MANDLLNTRPRTQAELDLIFRLRPLARQAEDLAKRPDVAQLLVEAIKLLRLEN